VTCASWTAKAVSASTERTFAVARTPWWNAGLSKIANAIRPRELPRRSPGGLDEGSPQHGGRAVVDGEPGHRLDRREH
jgi:hypothetical protein